MTILWTLGIKWLTLLPLWVSFLEGRWRFVLLRIRIFDMRVIYEDIPIFFFVIIKLSSCCLLKAGFHPFHGNWAGGKRYAVTSWVSKYSSNLVNTRRTKSSACKFKICLDVTAYLFSPARPLSFHRMKIVLKVHRVTVSTSNVINFL